mgnify:CR=1 FL=1
MTDWGLLFDGVPGLRDGPGAEIRLDQGVPVRRPGRQDGRGLATACGARLILECLDRGLYPSWDAIDLRSAALAEKLGYRRGDPYPGYWIGEA